MMDRRTTLKWMLAASATVPALGNFAWTLEAGASVPGGKGYGPDPNLLRSYKPGDLWPLTFSQAQQRTAAALSDLIIPADAHSPSASAVGVVDFLDEWVSAPYPQQQEDRKIVFDGFTWLDGESRKRFKKVFAALEVTQQRAICDDICLEAKAKPRFVEAAKFFARYRDLTAGGFYTTPQGMKDLQYMDNIPMARYDGPPLAVLKRVGLA